jgi:hypothetical protein
MVAPLVVFMGIAMCGPPLGVFHLPDKHPVLAVLALFLVATLLGSAIYGLRRFTQAIVGAEMPPERDGESGSSTDGQASSSGSMTRMDRQRPWRKRQQ